MYIYELTNTATGNFYVGQRSAHKGTPEEATSYWSSSKIVKRIFAENPINGVKEIVSVHSALSELSQMERQIVLNHWVIFCF